MLPGDVYYYSTNSYVLCVKQNSHDQPTEPTEEVKVKVNNHDQPEPTEEVKVTFLRHVFLGLHQGLKMCLLKVLDVVGIEVEILAWLW